MEKEEILLGEEMRRLEIEPIKLNKNKNSDNPFISSVQKKIFFKNTTHAANKSKCTCSIQKKRPGNYNKKHNKILKEPLLKVLKNCGNKSITLDAVGTHDSTNKIKCDVVRSDPLNLCTLVHNCNQLTISSTLNEHNNLIVRDVNGDHKWWRKEISNLPEPKEAKQQNSHTGTCSQQALNPPCDITIDELASYFETLVHIPKKMSSMAEMMYI